ncbi:GPI ethanolamine phosphate transferase 1 [Strongyloides ratti]|uniref:GPI ethanolamine phosphate transferase 1 n=1 Tax=Strongyloides ratti TaxID=34506 RepID=A0A090MXN3_STRRB|nr:GPI ethanolamine phosphate transferase 1 [Strongyloides ratti]CEF65734.1 GPI ethanolamine phosphate transferase 1 [Strongyloides ratti]
MNLLLITLGVVIAHQILIFAPFTIFFTSPILNISRSHEISTQGLAKRLVIFSAGGIRENVFYQNLPNITFLNKLIVDGKALFGVGETHLFTHDTRGNYIVSTTGSYEDILGMILQTTPIKIDTIFDRSAKSYIFGSQSIVKLFDKNNEKIKTFPFIQKSKKYQNYEISSRWIFENVKQFYKNDSYKIHERHIFKSTSKEYLNMLIEIDKNISEIYKIIENIYPDRSTAYIFTSDHGISDLGKHGENSEYEKQIPFIAWGSGIQVYRRKQHIKQIDISSYLSSLIGIAIPKNNLGIVPQQYLKSSPTYKYQASCGNLKQMVEQYLIKREQIYNHTFFFKENTQFTKETLSTLTKEVTRLVENRRYDIAASMCLNMIPRVKKALYYYHNYDRNFLTYCLSITFILWVFIIHEIIGRYNYYNAIEYHDLIPKPLFQVYFFIAIIIDIYLGKSFSYSIHHLIPVYLLSLFNNIFSITSYIGFLFRIPLNIAKGYLIEIFINFITKIIPLALFLCSFYDRRFLSLILLALSLLPYLHHNKTYPYNIIWSIGCVFLSIFPFLPLPVSQEYSKIILFITFIIGTIIFIYHSCLFLSYSILTISYELLFLLVFIIILYSYVRLEHGIYFENEFLNIKLISIPSSSDDAIFGRFSNQEYQRAYIAMSLFLVAFFSIDNITSFKICNISIPSFFKIFPSTTLYCLLFLKKIIPIFIVTLAISSTLARRAGALYRFSILIMILSNIMAFFMFLNLKDEGTWIEIRVALSNYLISITLSLLVFILLNISNIFMLWDCPNIRIFFQLQDPLFENEKKNKESV